VDNASHSHVGTAWLRRNAVHPGAAADVGVAVEIERQELGRPLSVSSGAEAHHPARVHRRRNPKSHQFAGSNRVRAPGRKALTGRDLFPLIGSYSQGCGFEPVTPA
jgi:hypothetical protein